MPGASLPSGAAVVPLHYGWDTDFWLNVGRLTGAALVAWTIFRRTGPPVARPDGMEREWRFFVMGSAVLAGGFFLTVGYLYKVIFAVWLLPVLLPLAARPGPWRNEFRFSLGCLVGMVWVEGLICAALSLWPQLTDAAGRVFMHRTAAVISGVLAWGFILPVVFLFGAELRLRWQQWQKSRGPA